MAMFGAAPRFTSMFAQPGYGAPQGAPQVTQGVPQPQAFAPVGGIMPDYKPALSDKLAAIGGILSQLGGYQNDQFAQYQQNIQQQRMLQQKARAEAAKMYQPQDVGGSLVRLNPQTGKYEAVYTPEPKPVNNDTANDYEYIKSHLGPEAADSYLRNIAAGPPMAVDNGDGTKTIYPRGAFGGAPAAGGPAPGMIKNGYRFKGGNPKDQNAWEPIGGATPSASGGFRR